jgi:hypothetical protein
VVIAAHQFFLGGADRFRGASFDMGHDRPERRHTAQMIGFALLFTDALRTKKWIRHVAETLPATINVSTR